MSTIINEFQDANGVPFGVGLPIVKLDSALIDFNGMLVACPKFIYYGSILGSFGESGVLISMEDFPEELGTQGSFTIEMSYDLENHDGVTPIMEFFSKAELTNCNSLKVMLELMGELPEGFEAQNIEQILEIKVSGEFMEMLRGELSAELVNSESMLTYLGYFFGNFHVGYFIKYQGNWIFLIDNLLIISLLGSL